MTFARDNVPTSEKAMVTVLWDVVDEILSYLDGANAYGPVHQVQVDGAAAGAVAVTGITTDDTLVSVLLVEDDTGVSMTDLTDEFTISDADEIDNTDGTATTGGFLIVTWQSPIGTVPERMSH